MSYQNNAFLNSGGGSDLTDGTAVINISSITCQSLAPSFSMKTDTGKKIVSSLLTTADTVGLPSALILKNELAFEEDDTHTTPAANTILIYAKTDGEMYKKDDAGVETALGGSAVPDGASESDYLRWDSVAGEWVVGSSKVSIGAGAASGLFQGTNAIAVGAAAGVGQGTSAIAIGDTAGTSQGTGGVAIGLNSGSSQGTNAIAVGVSSGEVTQATKCISIGDFAGQTRQGNVIGSSIAIGDQAGFLDQSEYATAIGTLAGHTGQNGYCVAVGYAAGQSTQSIYSVAIGQNAGRDQQGQACLALGPSSGRLNQGQNGVSIGRQAGRDDQGISSVSVGNLAGQISQGTFSTAIGNESGQLTQSSYSTAIGYRAGNSLQSSNCVALGYRAGETNQHARTVILNGDSVALNSSTTDGLYISPIRAAYSSTDDILKYNSTTKEVVRSKKITLDPGTVAAPSLNFTGALTTGLSVPSGNIVLSRSGVSVFDASATETLVRYSGISRLEIDGTNTTLLVPSGVDGVVLNNTECKLYAGGVITFMANASFRAIYDTAGVFAYLTVGGTHKWFKSGGAPIIETDASGVTSFNFGLLTDDIDAHTATSLDIGAATATSVNLGAADIETKTIGNHIINNTEWPGKVVSTVCRSLGDVTCVTTLGTDTNLLGGTISGSKIIPANFMEVGSCLKIKMGGWLTWNTLTGNSQLKFQLIDDAGSPVTVTLLDEDYLFNTINTSERAWDLELNLQTRTVGATAQTIVSGKWTVESVSGVSTFRDLEGFTMAAGTLANPVKLFDSTKNNTIVISQTTTIDNTGVAFKMTNFDISVSK